VEIVCRGSSVWTAFRARYGRVRTNTARKWTGF